MGDIDVNFDHLIDNYINSDGDETITKEELNHKYTGPQMNFERLWKLVADGKESVPVTEMKEKIRTCQEMDSWQEAAQINKAIWTNVAMNFVGLVHFYKNAVVLDWSASMPTAFGQFVVLAKVQLITIMLLFTEIRKVIAEVDNNRSILKDFGEMYNAVSANKGTSPHNPSPKSSKSRSPSKKTALDHLVKSAVGKKKSASKSPPKTLSF